MNRQRDAVGLIAFDDRIVTHAAGERPAGPPARAARDARPARSSAGETNVAKPLHQLAEALTKRGLVVLISDLLDDPDAVVRGLKHFQFRGTDVIVFHVLDADEIEFPFERATRFEDLETGDEVMAVPSRRARALPAGDRGAHRALPPRARRARGSTTTWSTRREPLELALLSYLSTRARTL